MIILVHGRLTTSEHAFQAGEPAGEVEESAEALANASPANDSASHETSPSSDEDETQISWVRYLHVIFPSCPL